MLYRCRGENLPMAEWAKRAGVSKQTMFNRLRHMSLEEAIDKGPSTTKPRVVVAAGQSRTVSEWVRLTRIPRSTILLRLKNGWSPEQALGLAEKPRRSSSCVSRS